MAMLVPWSNFFTLLVSVLATWRLAHLLVREDGPFDLVLRLRVRLGEGFAGRTLDCPYCLSLWLAAPFAVLLADGIVRGVVAWLAISGGACALERALEHRGATANADARDAAAPSEEP